MTQKSYFSLLLISAVFAVALSACGSPESSAPTMDVNEIVQQVAATLQMGFTQTAQAMPTSTNTPEPTETPLPSATLEPLLISTATVVPSSTAPASLTALPINPATANGCYNAWFVKKMQVEK